MAQAPAYKRILLKLSGEALMGEDSYGINRDTINRIVAEVAGVSGLGVEGAVVTAGGTASRRLRKNWLLFSRTDTGGSLSGFDP